MARNPRVAARNRVSSLPAVYPLIEPLERRALLSADLTGSFLLPEGTQAPTGAVVELPVLLNNLGDTKVGGKVEVDLFASADGTLDEATDISLGRVSVGVKLDPGATAQANLKVTLPAGAAAGDYTLFAKLDPQNKVVENNEGNNLFSSEVLEATQPDYDLTGALSDYKGPAAVVAGTATKASVKVTLSNAGTLALPKGMKVSVLVVARPVGLGNSSQDRTLGGADISVSGLAGGADAKAKSINLAFPDNLPSNDYELVAIIDNAVALAETSESNNTDKLDGTDIDVAAPFVDLSGAINNASLPDAVVAGDGAKITLPLEITNNGNVPVASGQTIDVQVFARPAGVGNASQDVLIGTVEDQSISKLKPGAVKKLKLSALLPAHLAENDYVLVTKIDSGGEVAESNENNNTAQTPADDAISVAEAFIDLSIDSASSSLSGDVDANKRGKAIVVVRHEGNVPVDGAVKIEVFATTNGTINGSSISIGVLDNAAVKLKPGATKSYNVNITVPEAVAPVTYQLVARITPLGGVPDGNTANHTAAVSTIQVTPGELTLGAILGAITFTQTSANGAQGRSDGTFTSSNGGSGTYSWFYSPSGTVDVTLVLKEVNFPFEPDGAGDQLSLHLAFEEIRPTSVNGRTLTLTKLRGDNTIATFHFTQWGSIFEGSFDDGFAELA